MESIPGEIRSLNQEYGNTRYASELKRQNPVENKNNGELSDEEKQEVARLKKADAKVRAHEIAHLTASAGISVSGARFDYKIGPDGQRYAVGGDVSIDTSKVPDDPEATMRKAQRIRSAALAPADPSAQDRKVAAMASQMEMEARMELAKKRAEAPEDGYDKTGNKQKMFGKVPTFQFTV